MVIRMEPKGIDEYSEIDHKVRMVSFAEPAAIIISALND